MSELDNAILKGRRAIGKDKLQAVLGDGTGQPRAGNGLYYVRKILAAGALSQPFKLPLAPGFNVTVADGTPVELGYDSHGNACIYPRDSAGMQAAGVSPYYGNALEQAVYHYLDPGQLPHFLCKRSGDITNNPWTVVVFVPMVFVDPTMTAANILAVDLTSLKPASGTHCYAVVCWKTDNTLEANASTAKSTGDPLTTADIDEGLAARTAGALPVWAWELSGDASGLSPDPTKNVDIRQWINTQDSGSGAAPANAHYVTTQAEAGLSNEFNLGGLTTGLLKISVSAGVATPSTAGDLVDYVSPAYIPYRAPVVWVGVADVNIASPGAIPDATSLSTGDRILLTAQSTGSQNGLWLWQGVSSALTRPTDYAAGSTLLATQGITVFVRAGHTTTYARSLWVLTTSGAITIDSTTTTWEFNGNIPDPVSLGAGSVAVSNGSVWIPATFSSLYDLSPIVGGRLSLSTSLPITTADQTGIDTIFYIPYTGNQIALYNTTDARWELYPIDAPAYTVSSLTANRIYDMFIYWNGSVLTLDPVVWNAPTRDTHISSISNASPRVVSDATAQPALGQLVVISGNSVSGNNAVWRVGTVTAGVSFTLLNLDNSNSSAPGSVGNNGTWEVVDDVAVTRATALATQNRIYVKDSAAARRFIGMFKTNPTAATVDDRVLKRMLVNYYNAAPRNLLVTDATDSWTYATASWRAVHNDLSNRVEFLSAGNGLISDFEALVIGGAASAAGASGVGIDSSSANSAQLIQETSVGALNVTIPALYDGASAAGYHYAHWIEYARTGTMTFRGDNGVADMISGMRGHIWG